MPPEVPPAPVRAAVELGIIALQAGRPLVVIDAIGHGVLAWPAHAAGPEVVNTLALRARGIVSIAVPVERALALGLSPSGQRSPASWQAPSIEARRGVSTGISVADRARTIAVVVDPASGPDDIVLPGHMFVVAVEESGVLVGQGLPEALVDLARIAGLAVPGVAYSRVLDDAGNEAGANVLRALALELGAPVLHVLDVVRYRTVTDNLVRCVERGPVNTRWGPFELSVWREGTSVARHGRSDSRAEAREPSTDKNTHLLFTAGGPEAMHGDDDRLPLVRVHSQCLTGDAFRSHRCDCGYQLEAAMELIAGAGRGALLYLRQEGRGIGLPAKLRAYALQDEGRDTVEANLELGYEADARDYGVGGRILLEAGFRQVALITNNPRKISGLEALGLHVARRVPAELPPLAENLRYLRSKKEKLGHMLQGLG